jgi:hypothetical protein
LICLNPEVAKKKFNIDFWYNTEDGQHYTLPGNQGLLSPEPQAPPPLSQGDGATTSTRAFPTGGGCFLRPHPTRLTTCGWAPRRYRPTIGLAAPHMPQNRRAGIFVFGLMTPKNLERIYISTPKRTAKINENTTIHAAPRLTASGLTATTQNMRRTVSSTACTRQNITRLTRRPFRN